jgi:membrane dipeptidase
MSLPIADLHCDLLSYLAEDARRSVYDTTARCSLPQLKQGNVRFQTFAIFTETNNQSALHAEKQFQIFCSLQQKSADFTRLGNPKLSVCTPKVQSALAIENASGLCTEEEPLEKAFGRLEYFQKTAGPIVYLSLTWNHENRFGGGNLTQCGLKPDGERLLHYLDDKKIAIDFSHTSDALADDILNYIDKRGLKLLPIASHSNFRSICQHPRNLPDPIAKEIIKRGGVIGLNLFKHFLGEKGCEDIVRHVEHARYLDALDQYCFGADFFYDQILPVSLYSSPYFHEQLSDAGCYPQLLMHLKQTCSQHELEQIAYLNVASFFERLKGKV